MLVEVTLLGVVQEPMALIFVRERTKRIALVIIKRD